LLFPQKILLESLSLIVDDEIRVGGTRTVEMEGIGRFIMVLN
jgi:hypothetical protein